MAVKKVIKSIVKISLITGMFLQQDKDVTVVDYNGLEPYLYKDNDSCYIINLWATWCAPCVKELPYFEQLNQFYKDKKVKVILVSLDFPKTYKNVLLPFIHKKNIKSEVLLLNDPNSNDWINKIDKSWSGSIPATLIYTKSTRNFYEKSFTYHELDSTLKQILLKQEMQ